MEKGLAEDPLKCECYLPAMVTKLLEEDKAVVTVLKSGEQWHGVTYQEDKPQVKAALAKMAEDGLYPTPLWK